MNDPCRLRASHPPDGAGIRALCALVVLLAGAGSLPAALTSSPEDQPATQSDAPSKPSIDEAREPDSVGVLDVDPRGLPAAWVADNFLGAQPAIAQAPVTEVEPNDTAATATPLGGTNAVGRGNIYRLSNGPLDATGDIDYWSFSGAQGDRVYAATMTAWAPSSSTDTTLELITTDGLQILETDLDDGSSSTTSSSIAGATLPATGTFYLRVRHSTNASRIAPYFLHFRLQSGAPTAEAEPNDTPATASPLPGNGWVSGARNPALATEQDWFSFSASAGDTVFLSLNLDPERDAVEWNGRLGIGLFGDLGNQLIVADDTSTGSAANPLSEALIVTVKTTGTYYACVDSATATVGGPTATYNLSVSVHPATPIGTNCTVYTSSDVPKIIGPGALATNSTITIPGNPRIEDLNLSLTLDHTIMSDIDAALISPAGNENSIVTDVGSTATGGQTQMDLDLDDEAGSPPSSTVLKGPAFQPELSYRLGWFKGEAAGGTWTLRLRDDANTANGGNLTAWSLTVCEPLAAPACSGMLVTVFATDFESSDAGFTTTAATPAPWQYGTPTAAPIATCNSGINCWKTGLTDLYSPNANQDLRSPTLNLSGLGAPITVRWAQKYQMESASFDTFWMDVREVGQGDTTNLFQFLAGSMVDSVGSPATPINESAGWGMLTRDIGAYANKAAVQLRWGFVSDSSGQLAGVAIDDVSVTACCTPASCNDNNPCTDDACDPVSGCRHTNNNANSCSDGNLCTTPDACGDGVCVPGFNPCEDNDACTVEVCDGQGSCAHAPLTCADDFNICTDDICLPATGCAYVNNALPCSDGNMCTAGDLCSGGACVPGPPPAAIQFCNANPISIPSSGVAAPYPSSVSVAAGPIVCSVTVSLSGVTHTFPDDLDVLLSAPAGQNAIIMSDVGGGNPGASGVNLTLDDAAATPLPDTGPLVSGTFRPNNVGAGDPFAAPAPAALGGSALSVFNGTNPNGPWSLWVMDDLSGDLGSIAAWCLNVRALCGVDADCDDGNPCTLDTCDTQSGACAHADNSAACDDGNACTDDRCDPQAGGCVHANNTSACTDGNPCTAGDVCGNGLCQPGAPITTPPEVGGLAAAADKVTYTWSAAAYATQYDVVRGLLAALPAGPGGGDEVCFADRVDASFVDATAPAPGDGFWYLVRAENSCGIGTYGTQSNGTPRATATCP